MGANEPQTFPSISGTPVQEGQPASEEMFADFRDRQAAASHKLVNLAHNAVTTSNGIGSPATATLITSGQRKLPGVIYALEWGVEVMNSDGATTGRARLTLTGGTNPAPIEIDIDAGDTAWTLKDKQQIVHLGSAPLSRRPGPYDVLIELWRDSGAGTVSLRALGVMSRVYAFWPAGL